MELYMITTCIALVTIGFLLFKPKSTKNHFPAEPWRLPIIGNMHHLIGSIPHRRVMDLSRKYGPLMHLQLGEVSTIVVSSPTWAKEILTKYDIIFANRPETITGEFIAYHNTDIALAPYGEYWKQLRKLCTLELFSPKKVKSFQSIREQECWKMVQEIKDSGSHGRPINLSENIDTMITTILCKAAFGKGLKDQKQFTELVKEISKQTGGFDVADFFPSKTFLHRLSGKRARMARMRVKLDNLINDIIAKDNGNTSNETLLDVLLRVKDNHEFPLTIDNIKAIIFDVFADTSSNTVEWVISELIRCPRAMKKVQAGSTQGKREDQRGRYSRP